MMEKIVVFGAGAISDVICYYINRDQAFDICAYCVDKAYITSTEYNGLPIVDFENVENIYPPSEYKMAILTGYQKVNKVREQHFLKAREKGYSCISDISKKATCDTSDIGENNYILDMSIIQPFVKIGNNNIIWSGSHVGHHSRIGNNIFLASPKISGMVEIGDNSFIGVNVPLGDNLKIGEACVIGAGSIVLKNIPDGTILANKQSMTMPVKTYDMEDILG